MPARVPALGLAVLQLSRAFEGHATLTASTHLHLHGRDLPVRRHDALPLRVLPIAASDFCLETQHLRACFAGPTGLLQVRGSRAGQAGWVQGGRGPWPMGTHCPGCPWQSVRRAGEEQDQRLSSEFFIYGTRTSKDKSGAYLFLPDGEAKVRHGHWAPGVAGAGAWGAGVGCPEHQSSLGTRLFSPSLHSPMPPRTPP